MIKQGLELKQQQKLSPLQIQTIKLIELPVQELEQRVGPSWRRTPCSTTPRPRQRPRRHQGSLARRDQGRRLHPGLPAQGQQLGQGPRPEVQHVLRDHELHRKPDGPSSAAATSRRGEHDIAAFIIGSLDEDGYLRRDVESLVDDMAFRAGIQTDAAEVTRMLQMIQEFEPAGVGARDLRECLLLQLRNCRQTPDVLDAERIVGDFFQEFSNKHFQKIMSRMGISEARLKKAMARIVRLNPSPGGGSDDSYTDRAQQIVPDFILENNDGELSFTMPRISVPELRVNKKYADLLLSAKGSSERAQKGGRDLRAAEARLGQMVRGGAQAEAEHPEPHHAGHTRLPAQLLRDRRRDQPPPHGLKDIAEKTGFDISTISRVVNSKYIETHFGIFPLKYFFSEGMENSDGEEVSTREPQEGAPGVHRRRGQEETPHRRAAGRRDGQARLQGRPPHHRQIPQPAGDTSRPLAQGAIGYQPPFLRRKRRSSRRIPPHGPPAAVRRPRRPCGALQSASCRPRSDGGSRWDGCEPGLCPRRSCRGLCAAPGARR